MGDYKNPKKKNHSREDGKKNRETKTKESKENLRGILQATFLQARIWILFGLIVPGLYALIMNEPILFTVHRGLYLIGVTLGIHAIVKSFFKKPWGMKDKEKRRIENERVRNLRNREIYRGFMVMGVALLLEIIDYYIL